MARLDYVPSGQGSTNAQTADVDYQRDGQEAPELVSLLVEQRSDGWRVTETFDKGGRTSKRTKGFENLEQAGHYATGCMQDAVGEQDGDESGQDGISREEALARASGHMEAKARHAAGRAKY